MDHSIDRHRSIVTMHKLAAEEVAGLMEGFHSNLEDGLFELAYRNSEPDHQRFCFDLMRELRFRKPLLMAAFSRIMGETADSWFAEPAGHTPFSLEPELVSLADTMAEKCMAHFSGLLRMLSQRIAAVTGINHPPESLPIGPVSLSRMFVASCRESELEPSSIEVLRELFLRFVLDRMGSVYGRCNRELQLGRMESDIPVLRSSV